jgi:hypothetical protein
MASPFQGAPFALTTASNPVRASIRAGHRREETGATATIRDPGTSQAWGNALKGRGARRMEGEPRDFPPWGLLHVRGMTADRCRTHLLPLEGESAPSGVALPPTPERQASDDPPGVEVPRSSDEFQPNFRRLAEHPEGSLAIPGDRRDARYRDRAGTSAARRPICRGRELALRAPEATPLSAPKGVRRAGRAESEPPTESSLRAGHGNVGSSASRLANARGSPRRNLRGEPLVVDPRSAVSDQGSKKPSRM